MALLISRAKHRTLKNPSLIHLFSTSSQNDAVSPPSPTPQQQQQQQHQQNQNQQTKKTTIDGMKLDDIRKSLSQFRSQKTEAQSVPNQPQKQFSFQESYKQMKSGMNNNNFNAGGGDSGRRGPSVRAFELNKIKESLKNMTVNRNTGSSNTGRSNNAGNVSFLKDTSKLVFGDDSSKASVVGGRGGSRVTKDDKKVGGGESSGLFFRPYSQGELGEKLKALRPEVKGDGKGWFSIQELNERLKKVREIDEKRENDPFNRLGIGQLRNTIMSLKESVKEQNEKPKVISISPMSMNSLPSYELEPPKEQLVEKYFHPDNMSSAEKLKIELSKVREEFKMSESDCGSARVQVAQLTTKIKHLSSVLHKKDKHSRKGLQEMVQRRKKLLKYLRRTDWDSFCFVISKLGLRDNPDFKYLVRN